MEAPKFEIVTEGKKKFLNIRCELPANAATSKSGKSLLYASTNGNLNTGLKLEGSDLVVGLNAYTKK